MGTTIGCTHTRNTKANESIETAGKQAMLVVQKDYNNLPDSSSRSPLKLTAHPGGPSFLIFRRHVYFLGWTPLRDQPPSKPPFQCPHPSKKGTNLLLFKFCIHLHTHQDLKLKCCRVKGQKLRYGRPCTQDLPGPTTGLHSPKLLPSKFH